MKTGFAVTFERWDDESLDIGETDDTGYVAQNVSLRDAIRDGLDALYPSWLNVPEADEMPVRRPSSFRFYNWNEGTRERIRKGIIEERTLHVPDDVTPASRRRIARLFGIKC